MKIHLTISALILLLICKPSFGQERDIRALKEFAEAYQPTTDKPAKLPTLPGKIKSSLLSLRQTHNPKLEQYLTFIFIKLYRSHLECCHQSYEVRTAHSSNIDSISDPLIYEYNLITQVYKPSDRIEMFSSSVAYDWVKKHPLLLKDIRIKREYDIIKSIEANIKKGKYWK
ncbi:MAG TPA: hypothetical protein PKN96_12290 [Flavobacterium sp.]|uniref:hypothetical protein n=1 Tax=Flavobacterium sp. TaxID=239 RepID=UPI002C92B9E1|nr:hypothetical protein [Flavobacterium sp.]HNP34063.1 hypothetical protein [Flavobacterium sp.]